MNFTPVFIYLLMYVCRLGGKRQEEVEAGGVIYQPGPTQSSFAQSLQRGAVHQPEVFKQDSQALPAWPLQQIDSVALRSTCLLTHLVAPPSFKKHPAYAVSSFS